MTEAEAIARLKDHFRIHDDGRPTPKLDEAVDIAINALEKQTAKNPKITSKVEDVEYMRCPDCQLTTVLYNGMRPLYCPNCGQKLDWSEV